MKVQTTAASCFRGTACYAEGSQCDIHLFTVIFRMIEKKIDRQFCSSKCKINKLKCKSYNLHCDFYWEK